MEPQKYRRIADDLRAQITSGQLKPGDQLPTLEALMKKHRTTTMTIRRALAELELQLLVETRPTVGTFVRNYRRHPLDLGDGALHEFVPEYPIYNERLLDAVASEPGATGEPAQTMTVDRVTPPTGVAERLGVASDAEVIRQRRVFYIGDDRVSMSYTFYPEHLVAGSPVEHPDPKSFRAFAELAKLGLPVVRLKWDLIVRNATAEECREMRWPNAMPVLIQLVVAHTHDQPVGCWVIVLPGDRVLLTQESLLRASFVQSCATG